MPPDAPKPAYFIALLRVPDIDTYRREYGREHLPFEINALATDAFDLDGYRRLADAGVTELQTVPWYFYGGDPDDLTVRLDSLARFADTIITRFA